jgi:hypothetical protein
MVDAYFLYHAFKVILLAKLKFKQTPQAEFSFLNKKKKNLIGCAHSLAWTQRIQSGNPQIDEKRLFCGSVLWHFSFKDLCPQRCPVSSQLDSWWMFCTASFFEGA